MPSRDADPRLPPPGAPDALARGIARVLKALLRPLVRAMIASGLTAPAVCRLLKEIYVEVAERDFALARGQRPTDSRISVLTGVHRKDVRAIRAAAQDDERAERQRVSAIASVLGRWLADPATTDAGGAPAALPRLADVGPSFERLAASVSKDIRPRTLLDELLRQGLVSIDPATDTVRLRGDAFVGPADFAQKAHFFAHNVGDHIAAAAENLLAAEPPFMERAVFYNRLRPDSVDRIEAVARARAAELLADLNRMAHASQARDSAAGDARDRFRFGVFFYREPEEGVPDGTDEAGGQGARTGTDRTEEGSDGRD